MTSQRRAKELLRLAGEVFKELSMRAARFPKGVERVTPATSLEELEDRAIEVRYMLSLEERGPIRNLTVAVERAGVCIIPIVGLKGVDGLSSWVNEVPVIGLSPNVPGDRFRFSLAHELGHLLMHTRKSEMTEGEANRFAGALLFPQEEFHKAMSDRPQLRDFVALKSAWGLAVSALIYRAHDLDHIDDSRYRALQIQMSKWKKSEPGRFEPAQGKLFSRLIEQNGGISEVAKGLGMNRRHIGDLLNWSHLRLA